MSSSIVPEPEGQDAPPPLLDPFLFPKAEPEPKRVPPSTPWAFAAALLGPLGSAAALVLAWFSLRRIARNPDRFTGRGWAFAAMALNALLLAAWSAGIYVLLPRFQEELRSMAAPKTASPSPPPPDDSSAAPSPPPLPSPLALPTSQPLLPPPSASAREPKTGTVPQQTTELRVGAISVVDIGFAETSLSAALRVQQQKAEEQGQTLLVMTVNTGCDPCDGVFASLPDPRMQSALARTRLVRVHIDVFQEDLDKLRIQRERWPGFFLLSADLSPRDAIDGGEWDDDIAANIAPVLDPFVRGHYQKRREKFRPLPPTGIAL